MQALLDALGPAMMLPETTKILEQLPNVSHGTIKLQDRQEIPADVLSVQQEG